MKNLFLIVFSLSIFALFSCGSNGEKAEVNEAADVAVTSNEAVTYTIDTNESEIEWEGTKPTGSHEGTIKIKEGTISVKDGAIESGNFVIDMTSINVTDLEGEDKAKLEAHLKGTVDDSRTDFFDIRTYPEAKFEITKVTKLDNDVDANYMIYGNLTLKDQTKEVGFKADVDIDDNELSAETPTFTIVRTEWGINFMSKSLMDGAKDRFINDAIGLEIDITAKR